MRRWRVEEEKEMGGKEEPISHVAKLVKSACEWVGEGGRLRFEPCEGSREIDKGGERGRGRDGQALRRADAGEGEDAEGRKEEEEGGK